MATSRPSRDQDFSAPDDPADGLDPSPLRRLVLAQLEEPGGAAVQLLTTGSAPAWPDAHAARAATDLGLGAAVEAFSPDAYLVQSALGERALRGDVRPGDGAVVACNYHDVPAANRGQVEERLRRLRDLGPGLDLDTEVTADLTGSGPRTVVAFYDSYRDAALFGADLCHRLGLRAWFFPLFREPSDEPGAGGLSDVELADIATEHELCFHTAAHTRVEDVTEATVAREVLDVHQRLTGLAGRPPRIGAWLGGSRWDEQRLGNRALRDLGLPYLISNWSLEAVPPPTTP